MTRIHPAVLLLALLILNSCSKQPAAPQAEASAPSETAAAAPGTGQVSEPAHGDETQAADAHTDHDSKHGGTFFMALNNQHHLEGVLESPGVFRVYLYDDHTRPLDRAGVEQTQAAVIWGDEDGSPQIEMKPAAEGAMLEAKAPGTVRFPVTLTLLVRFPGAPADARRELFTFPFSHYSHRPSQSHDHPEGTPAH
jgi:hypothetical protein